MRESRGVLTRQVASCTLHCTVSLKSCPVTNITIDTTLHTVDNLEGGFKTFYLTNFNGVFDSVPLSWVHVKVDRSMIQPYMVWFGIYGQKTAKISLFQ